MGIIKKKPMQMYYILECPNCHAVLKANEEDFWKKFVDNKRIEICTCPECKEHIGKSWAQLVKVYAEDYRNNMKKIKINIDVLLKDKEYNDLLEDNEVKSIEELNDSIKESILDFIEAMSPEDAKELSTLLKDKINIKLEVLDIYDNRED